MRKHVCLHFETTLWYSQSQVSLSLYMSHRTGSGLLSRVLQIQNIAYKPPSENKPHQKVEKLHISRGFYTRLYGMRERRIFCFMKTIDEAHNTIKHPDLRLTPWPVLYLNYCWTGSPRYFVRYHSRPYCNFTNFRCVKISVASDHGAFGFV